MTTIFLCKKLKINGQKKQIVAFQWPAYFIGGGVYNFPFQVKNGHPID